MLPKRQGSVSAIGHRSLLSNQQFIKKGEHIGHHFSRFSKNFEKNPLLKRKVENMEEKNVQKRFKLSVFVFSKVLYVSGWF